MTETLAVAGLIIYLLLLAYYLSLKDCKIVRFYQFNTVNVLIVFVFVLLTKMGAVSYKAMDFPLGLRVINGIYSFYIIFWIRRKK